jgi:hypothetical protein
VLARGFLPLQWGCRDEKASKRWVEDCPVAGRAYYAAENRCLCNEVSSTELGALVEDSLLWPRLLIARLIVALTGRRCLDRILLYLPVVSLYWQDLLFVNGVAFTLSTWTG